MPEINRLRKLIRSKQVDAMIGIGKELRLQLQKAGQFPLLVIIKKGAPSAPDVVGYFQDEIENWMASLQRRPGVGKPLPEKAYASSRRKAAATHAKGMDAYDRFNPISPIRPIAPVPLREMIQLAQEHDEGLEDWERSFLQTIAAYEDLDSLSSQQEARLRAIVAKVKQALGK